MAKLFDIVDMEIVLNSDIIAIPALRKIWDRDKTKTKDKAKKELTFVAFYCDYLSPYKDLAEDIKEETIVKDVFKEEWEPDEIIEEAMIKYRQLQETPNMRLLLSAKRNVDKLASYFDTIDFTKEDDYGKPKYSAKDLSSNLKDVGSIVKSLTILEKQVQSEILEGNIRGQSEIGPYELPRKTGNADRSEEE